MNILYIGSTGTSGYAVVTKNSIFNLLINNAGYHFFWCYNVENKLLSYPHQEDNTPERYQKVRDRVKRLEDTKLMNDLPKFLYENYSKYMYKIS
jgi:hypothetical protein